MLNIYLNKIMSTKNVMVKICVNLIVKNEEKVMKRFFKSHKIFMDHFFICDTGSTDKTIEVINRVSKKMNVPGEIIEKPFKDFAYSRSYSLFKCREYIDKVKKDGELWYILFSDADNEILYPIGMKSPQQNYRADIYYIDSVREGYRYHAVLLVKHSKNLVWFWEQPVHERVLLKKGSITDTGKPFAKEYVTPKIVMKSGNDGGARKRNFHTYIHDALVLEKYINEHNEYKDISRVYFFLIQSYINANIIELAEKYIDIYLNSFITIEKEKFGEINYDWNRVDDFLYFTYYRLFKIKEFQKKTEEVGLIEKMMKGLKYNKERLEIPYCILHLIRYQKSDKYLGYFLFKDICKKYLDDDDNGVNRNIFPYEDTLIYKYSFFMEFCIFAISNKDYNLYSRCFYKCKEYFESKKETKNNIHIIMKNHIAIMKQLMENKVIPISNRFEPLLKSS